MIAILVIALYTLLPFYELLDYNEHWPNDGHYVAVIFTILFVIEIPRILRKVNSVVLRLLQKIRQFTLDPSPTVPAGQLSYSSCTSSTPLFMRFCRFRI